MKKFKAPVNYHEEVVAKISAKLKDDKAYYGEYGQQWLSNSDLYSLLNDPKTFRQPQKTTKAMIEGSYLHHAMLEPEKLSDYEILPVASRNTKLYKEAVAESDQEILLLQSEVDNIDKCIQAMKSNIDFCENIYKIGNKFEVPSVGSVAGMDFKGKADIVCDECLIDIKTTSNIKDFKYSARKYNYDSQAYIYQQLFGRHLQFYVVDKTTHQLGIFNPTQEFLDRGRDKVKLAITIYDQFFGEFKTNDINQYISYEDL